MRGSMQDGPVIVGPAWAQADLHPQRRLEVSDESGCSEPRLVPRAWPRNLWLADPLAEASGNSHRKGISMGAGRLKKGVHNRYWDHIL